MRKIKLFSNRKFKIFVITFILIVPIASHFNLQEIKLHKINNIRKITFTQPMDLLSLVDYDVRIVETEKKEVKKESKAKIFTITAYDLSMTSCGKSKRHPQYGISSRGVDLRGKNYKTARVVAVNPKIIPIGSKLKIEFLDNKYKKYSGIYTASDTTSKLINDHIIDLYLAESAHDEAKNFGKTQALVEIINE